MRSLCRHGLIFAIAACASPTPRVATHSATTPSLPLDVDHVIVAIDTLESGIEELRQHTDLTAVYGGAHPGRGTHNALLSLGPGKYIEILAPNPKDSVRTPRTNVMSTYRKLLPIGWAIHTRNADSLRTAVMQRGLPGGNVVPGSRERPDAPPLRWRSLTPWGAFNRSILPFFIEWSPGPHPSSESPTGCTLISLRLSTARPDSLRALLAAASVRVPVDSGPRDAMFLELECPTGRVKLPAMMGSRFDSLRRGPAPTAAGVSLGIARDSVEKLLGKPDRVGPTPDGLTLLAYNRGQRDALQVGLRGGAVEGVNLLTREAGSIDSMTAGIPFVRLFSRWGEPTSFEDRPASAVWRTTGWEIVAHPDAAAQALTVRFLQLRRNGIRECPIVTDSTGRQRAVCDIPLNRP